MVLIERSWLNFQVVAIFLGLPFSLVPAALRTTISHQHLRSTFNTTTIYKSQPNLTMIPDRRTVIFDSLSKEVTATVARG